MKHPLNTRTKKMLMRSLCTGALVTLLSGYAAAESLDVTFSANIRETTCDIKIDGGTGEGMSNNIVLGTNGKTRVDHIAGGTITSPFKLTITACPSSLNALKTTVSGTASTMTTALANSITVGSGGASNVGLSIARTSARSAPFEINSTDDSKRLVWTPGEIANKEVELTASLVETKTNSAAPGEFRALAIFNFTYE
ncbi:MAG: fimbrial protein [Leclercia sp.]